ncbi:hypothetical protein LIER_33422 [Lithospermum erythrorhizon]|uniref:Uncharacterized protein n=1 Tax=Lithospermum erythrorhizon TaxID=34254 RepID=A0AAV3RYX9_LITER
MSPKTLESRSSMESCTLHLRTWRPFASPQKTIDSDSSRNYSTTPSKPKRPCRADRTTSFPIDSLEFSKLTLFDDDRPAPTYRVDSSYNLFARKRRRKGSRSVSGRSSDRSGTRRRYCSVGASAAYGTCSDFPMPLGTDSSGELFMNGDPNWSSDVSEAARNGKREKCGGVGGGGTGEKETVNLGFGHVGNFDSQGNESGYGSEPGYRGDAEFGDGDEIDEEEDYPRVLFWNDEFGGNVANPKRPGENTLQKTHHRCRRKKHDIRMVDPIG